VNDAKAHIHAALTYIDDGFWSTGVNMLRQASAIIEEDGLAREKRQIAVRQKNVSGWLFAKSNDRVVIMGEPHEQRTNCIAGMAVILFGSPNRITRRTRMICWMRIKIIDEAAAAIRKMVAEDPQKFRVQVWDGDVMIVDLDWYGGMADNGSTHPFEYHGKLYVLFGPYHSFQEDDHYRLFEMKEVARER
jgi:hypothetical protein